MWIDKNGIIYGGEAQTGDRALTPQELAAWQASQAALVTAQAADEQAKTDAKTDPVIQYLRDHTPAECAAYVQTNVTSLATAKDVLAKMAMALSVLCKKEFR